MTRDRARGPPVAVISTATVVVGMDLGFDELVIGDAPVLRLRGDADLSTLPLLHQRVSRFASENHGRHAVIDLDGLDAVDPVAFGVLISARLVLRKGGGELDLVCNEPSLVALFARSGLDATFPVYSTVEAAVRPA